MFAPDLSRRMVDAREGHRLPAPQPNARRALAGFALVGAFFCAAPSQAAAQFVQQNYAIPQAPQSTVAVQYKAAQTAGDLNVVVVGWNDSTAKVISVDDSQGNRYQRAVGPTVLAGKISQSIYYAKNINGAAAN